MAKNSGQKKPLHELRQEIAHSRDRLARDFEGLRYELDFPLKFRKSFQRKTGVWVASSAVLGIVLSVLPARTKTVTVKATTGKSKGKHQKEGILGAGIAVGALKLAATLLKPAVTSFIAKKMRGPAGGARTGRNW